MVIVPLWSGEKKRTFVLHGCPKSTWLSVTSATVLPNAGRPLSHRISLVRDNKRRANIRISTHLWCHTLKTVFLSHICGTRSASIRGHRIKYASLHLSIFKRTLVFCDALRIYPPFESAAGRRDAD